MRQGAAIKLDEASTGPEGETNPFVRFFSAPVSGRGIIRDRFGRKRASFSIDLLGQWEGGEFVLRESFVFDSGRRERREWRARFHEDGRFEAECAETVGVAQGRTFPNEVRTDYVFRLRTGGREFKLRFDDRIHFFDDGTALNIATMKKFGVKLAELTLCLRRRPG